MPKPEPDTRSSGLPLAGVVSTVPDPVSSPIPIRAQGPHPSRDVPYRTDWARADQYDRCMIPLATVSAPYIALYTYLKGRYADNIVLTFAQIEDLLGVAVPPEAHERAQWWTDCDGAEPSPQSRAWTQANRTAAVNLFARTVRFERAVV